MQETNKNEKDLLLVGKSHFENKDYQNAIKTFSKATKLQPDNIDNWFWLGQSHLRIMQYKQAIKSFKKKGNTYTNKDYQIVVTKNNIKTTINFLSTLTSLKKRFIIINYFLPISLIII